MNAIRQDSAFRPDRWAPAFAAAAAVVLGALWYFAARREGFFEQEQPMDQSLFYCTALDIKRALAEHGLVAFADRWVNSDPIHAPLVPTVSAILMMIFGESFVVAQLTFSLFTFVLALSLVRIVERFYGPGVAYATAALSLVFPVSLIVSRTYLFEFPFAALFAASGWAYLTSDRFSRWRPSLLVGLLVGLACLTRMGGHALLAGMVIVLGVDSWGGAERARRMFRFACALALAAAVAATWYLPNVNIILDYVNSTRGVYAAAGVKTDLYFYWLVSRVNLESIVREGPGVPLAVIALAAWLWTLLTTRGRFLVSGLGWALAAIFAIDLAIIVASIQIVGARYCLPIMPILALWVVRSIQALRPWAVKIVVGGLACVLAGHHLVALTWTFPVQRGIDGDEARAFAELQHPWWNHVPTLVTFACGMRLPDIATPFRVREVVQRITEEGLPRQAKICVIADHPFFGPNSLRLRAMEARQEWSIRNLPNTVFFEGVPLDLGIVDQVLACDLVVIREGGNQLTPFTVNSALMDVVRDPVRGGFEKLEPTIALGDGSIAVLYRRVPDLGVSRDVPGDQAPVIAHFRDAMGEVRMDLTAAEIRSEGGTGQSLYLTFRCVKSSKSGSALALDGLTIPTAVLLTPPENGNFHSARVEGRALSVHERQALGGGDAWRWRARFPLSEVVLQKLPNLGIALVTAKKPAGSAADAGTERMAVESQSRLTRENTVLVLPLAELVKK